MWAQCNPDFSIAPASSNKWRPCLERSDQKSTASIPSCAEKAMDHHMLWLWAYGYGPSTRKCYCKAPPPSASDHSLHDTCRDGNFLDGSVACIGQALLPSVEHVASHCYHLAGMKPGLYCELMSVTSEMAIRQDQRHAAIHHCTATNLKHRKSSHLCWNVLRRASSPVGTSYDKACSIKVGILVRRHKKAVDAARHDGSNASRRLQRSRTSSHLYVCQ